MLKTPYNIFILTVVLFCCLFPAMILAEDSVKFKPQVTIPASSANRGFDAQSEIPVSNSTIGQYIAGIYAYGIGAVGILAVVVMMFGGIMMITSGGNQEQVSKAKSWISASVTGLVLALSSFSILYWINPDLTSFKPLDGVKKIDYIKAPEKSGSVNCAKNIGDACSTSGAGAISCCTGLNCESGRCTAPKICLQAFNLCTTSRNDQGYCDPDLVCQTCLDTGACSRKEQCCRGVCFNYSCEDPCAAGSVANGRSCGINMTCQSGACLPCVPLGKPCVGYSNGEDNCCEDLFCNAKGTCQSSSYDCSDKSAGDPCGADNMECKDIMGHLTCEYADPCPSLPDGSACVMPNNSLPHSCQYNRCQVCLNINEDCLSKPNGCCPGYSCENVKEGYRCLPN